MWALEYSARLLAPLMTYVRETEIESNRVRCCIGHGDPLDSKNSGAASSEGEATSLATGAISPCETEAKGKK